jgi:hypothetical protein
LPEDPVLETMEPPVDPAVPFSVPMGPDPEFVGFYRWYLPDPVTFADELTVTIQQIGAMFFGGAADEPIAAYELDHPVAGEGWVRIGDPARVVWGVAERVDVATAIADIARRDYETASRVEMMNGLVPPGDYATVVSPLADRSLGPNLEGRHRRGGDSGTDLHRTGAGRRAGGWSVRGQPRRNAKECISLLDARAVELEHRQSADQRRDGDLNRRRTSADLKASVRLALQVQVGGVLINQNRRVLPAEGTRPSHGNLLSVLVRPATTAVLLRTRSRPSPPIGNRRGTAERRARNGQFAITTRRSRLT